MAHLRTLRRCAYPTHTKYQPRNILLMTPYRITSASLITYSGKVVPIEINKVFTEPIRKVKDMILDAFCKICKESKDPFVRIEVITKELISWK